LAGHHEAASKFLSQKIPRLNIQQTEGCMAFRLVPPSLWTSFGRSASMGRTARILREKLMKKLVFAILLISSPAWAQTKLVPKGAAARADNCAPIGRTADGKLVYSMKCDNLPAPPPPPQAEIREVPAPEPEVQRSGIFGWSFDKR
jgi:hypothetical protein